RAAVLMPPATSLSSRTPEPASSAAIPTRPGYGSSATQRDTEAASRYSPSTTVPGLSTRVTSRRAIRPPSASPTWSQRATRWRTAPAGVLSRWGARERPPRLSCPPPLRRGERLREQLPGGGAHHSSRGQSAHRRASGRQPGHLVLPRAPVQPPVLRGALDEHL